MVDYQTITIGAIILGIILWFILRELNCWYLKTNKILQSVEDLRKDFNILKSELRQQIDSNSEKVRNKNNFEEKDKIREERDDSTEETSGMIKCIHCGTLRYPNHSCPNCHRW